MFWQRGDFVSTQPGRKKPFYRSLTFRVLVGLVAGILIGFLWPHFGEQLRPFGDLFIKLIRMIVAPIIFLSVVVGIANVGDMRKLGRMGLKALVYFEVVTTIALLMALAVANIFQPGRGMNVDVSHLDANAVAQYATAGKQTGTVDFLMNIVPDTFVGAFSKGEILQVLFLAILTGLALTSLNDEKYLIRGAQSLSSVCYKIVSYMMEAAPIGIAGAMAFTVGKYGVVTLLALGKLLLCVYLTSLVFVVVVLGAICLLNGIHLWRFLVYIREEILIVFGTSSSEVVLPRMLVKMEKLGCSKAVTGLVIPSGYSFNLDGTSIYLGIAALFVAQATNTHLTLGQQIFILLVLMLNSKGAAAVSGGGFITLAGTLTAVGSIPVAGLAILLGVDRFMSQARSMVNLIGNGIATIVIAKWEKQFDAERAEAMLRGEATPELTLVKDIP
jgi:aerobic C4-dicarboxylate transport protein